MPVFSGTTNSAPLCTPVIISTTGGHYGRLVLTTVRNPIDDAKSQARRAAGPQSLRRRGDRCGVCWPSVLRCPRLGPGQVRHGAMCRSGGPVGHPYGRHVWFFSSSLLCGSVNARMWWPSRISASTTRSATSHKLRPEIVTVLRQARVDEPMIPSSQLAERIHAEFGVRVHRRTIERVLGPRPKYPTSLQR